LAFIPPRFLDAVVAIGTNSGSNGHRWIGTGFLYSRAQAGSSARHAFLVSARHVLQNKRKIVLRLNAESGDSSADFEVPLLARNGRQLWVGHPDPAIDIGVLEINYALLKKHDRRLYLLHSDDDFAGRDDLQAAGVAEGQGIFVLGFPMAIVGDKRQYVICRSGVVARIRDTLAGQNEFLVDASVYPGNSGGPVLLQPRSREAEGEAKIMGIVKSYLPYEDVAKSTQTRMERIRFQENSGLASAHPADLIRETVDLAFRRVSQRRSAARARAKKAAATATKKRRPAKKSRAKA
jgi:hypothetical protein